ncbi:glycosyltransferase family 2 protein [Candidatus Roizmanbacteria bacterium]|nr:MAG: glycosyltransferase family 2 protein [Candidatus Roizmanbacteria bacterium]
MEYLKKSLKSALDQTYDNIEIVISDNSENNDTKKYIESLDNKKIRYIKNKINIGPFLNSNQVVSLSKGKYVKYLLDDDLLHSSCVEKMVTIFEKFPSVGVVMAPLNIIDTRGNEITPRFYFVRQMHNLYRYKDQNMLVPKKKIMEDFLTKVYPCCVPTGYMFRKSLYDELGKPDEQFGYIGDVELCMSFATKQDFYYLDEYLSSWRYSPTSETVSILHKKGTVLDIFYRVTHKYLHYTNNIQKAYFFASKRTVINIIAGIRSKNIPLIIETIKTILYNDPYILNKLYLPFDILFEVLKSFIPYEKKR